MYTLPGLGVGSGAPGIRYILGGNSRELVMELDRVANQAVRIRDRDCSVTRGRHKQLIVCAACNSKLLLLF